MLPWTTLVQSTGAPAGSAWTVPEGAHVPFFDPPFLMLLHPGFNKERVFFLF